MKYILGNNLIGRLLTEAFSPKSELVLKIKAFLDKSFVRKPIDDIGEDGNPKLDYMVSRISQSGQEIQVLTMPDLLLLLDDKYNDKIKNDDDRKKFLEQVISDWYFHRIDRNGILSVNTIK